MARWRSILLLVLGYGLLALAGFVYLVSGLVVPVPWLVPLLTIWAGLVVWALIQRAHPWRVFATPFVAAVIWVAYVQGLGSLFNWTA